MSTTQDANTAPAASPGDPLRISPPFAVSVPTDDTVLLQSSDGLRFLVDRILLCANSAVFRDTLNVPQASEAVSQSRIISVTETSAILEQFLKILASHDSPSCASLDDVLALALLSRKYDAPCILRSLRADVLSLASQDPLHAYAIAARFSWESEARHISTLTLELDVYTMSNDDVDHMSASYFRRLGELHHRRETMARERLRTFNLVGSSYAGGQWWATAREKYWAWFQEIHTSLWLIPCESCASNRLKISTRSATLLF